MKRKLICGYCKHRMGEKCFICDQNVISGMDVCTAFEGKEAEGCGQCAYLKGIVGDWGTCGFDGTVEHVNAPRCDYFREKNNTGQDAQ